MYAIVIHVCPCGFNLFSLESSDNDTEHFLKTGPTFLSASSWYGWYGLEFELTSHTNPISSWLWSGLHISPNSFLLWKLSGCNMVLVSSRFQGHKFTGSRLSIHPFKHSPPSKYRIKDNIKGSYQKGNQGDNEGSPRTVGRRGPSIKWGLLSASCGKNIWSSLGESTSSSRGISSFLRLLFCKYHSAPDTFREVKGRVCSEKAPKGSCSFDGTSPRSLRLCFG